MPYEIPLPLHRQSQERRPTGADPQALQYRTTLCENFMNSKDGKCRYGPRCMFAHGEEHRRTVEDNLRNGLVSKQAIKAYQRHGQQIAAKRRAAKEEVTHSQTGNETSTTTTSTTTTSTPSTTSMANLSIVSNACASDSSSGVWWVPGSHNPYVPIAITEDKCDTEAPFSQRVVVCQRVRGIYTKNCISV